MGATPSLIYHSIVATKVITASLLTNKALKGLVRLQKQIYNRHGKYFLCENFKGKAAVRVKIFGKKIRSVKILRYPSMSILKAALCRIHANQTPLICLVSLLAVLLGDQENTAAE